MFTIICTDECPVTYLPPWVVYILYTPCNHRQGSKAVSKARSSMQGLCMLGELLLAWQESPFGVS